MNFHRLIANSAWTCRIGDHLAHPTARGRRRTIVVAEAKKQEVEPWDPLHEVGFPHWWDPFRKFGRPSPEFERMIEELVGTRPAEASRCFPLIDFAETDDFYGITTEVPGITRDDLTVEIHEDVLSIRGEKKPERQKATEKDRHLERPYGAFSRSFRLPSDANGNSISASFEDGVLTLTIPKIPDAKPTVIAIKG